MSAVRAQCINVANFIMSRKRQLIFLPLLLFALLLGQQDSVSAWKPYTHTKTLEPALAEVVRTGSVTINGRRYPVRSEIKAALTNHSEFYDAGSIGPDGFPDIIFGQSIIHPENTGAWLQHIHDRAWAAQSDSSYTSEEKSQILAFSYGYLTHAAGDMWAHTLINDISDGIFPAIKDIVTDVESAKIALRHTIIEGYIRAATADFDSNPERGPAPFGDISGNSTLGIKFQAPHRFVYETLVDPSANTPAPGRGVHLDMFIELRDALDDEVNDKPSKPLAELVKAYENSVDDLADIKDAAKDALSACDVIKHPLALVPKSSDNVACLNALGKLGITSVKSFENAVSGAQKTAAAATDKAFDILKDGYLSAWVDDIDEGLEHWNELGLATTNAMFDPQATRDVENEICRFEGGENDLIRAQCEADVTFADVVLDQSDDFINDYMISMLGAPDAVGDLRSALDDFSEPLDFLLGKLELPLNPLKEADAQIDQFAEDLVIQMVEDRFGLDIEQFEAFVTHPSHWINAESQSITLPGNLGTQTVELFSKDSHARLDALMGLPAKHHVPSNIPTPGASTRLADNVAFDQEKFAPFKNTVTMAKLLLLDAKGLNSVLTDALVDSPEVKPAAKVNKYQDNNVSPANIMIDGLDGKPWLLSIDADHAWRVDGLPRFPKRKPGILPHGGTGQFPIWEECSLRPAFRMLFTDWENDLDKAQKNFPDLGDGCSNVEQVPVRTVTIDTGGLTASFDWSMPSRLGADNNGDGLMDYYTTSISSNLPVRPLVMEMWQVDFTACDSIPGSRAITQYIWTVRGVEQPPRSSCNGFSYDEFPGEGTYEVTLTVVDADGRQESTSAFVVVQDWLIVSFGDSYASGEGAPDIPIAYDNGFWRTVCSLDPYGITRGFMEDGTCYSIPPLGVPGIITPAIPELCNGGTGIFQNGKCWTVLPTDGVPGVVFPAQPSLCNGGTGTFKNGLCWTLVETIGVPGIETPAVSALCNLGTGTFQGGECWTTTPKSVSGYKGIATLNVCVAMVDLDLSFTPSSNCSISVPGVHGVITPAVPATCDAGFGTFVDGECWTVPPVDGILGIASPATPKLCNGSIVGFSKSGECWLVPPGVGLLGVVTPAILATCNGDPKAFGPGRECWTVPQSGGSTLGAMLVEGCFSDSNAIIPGIASPLGGSKKSGANCFKLNTDLGDLSATWQNAECNRSANSGHAKAALAIEQADPRTSVTFVHLACSGDKTVDMPDQISEATQLIGDREIDAVVISIGGNDVKFGPIVKACIMQQECFQDDFKTVGGTVAPIACLFATPFGKYDECEDFVTGVGGGPNDPSGQKMFFDAIFGPGCTQESSRCRNLLDLYKNLKEVDLLELNGLTPLDSSTQRDERVYLVQYPDLTKDDNLSFCDPNQHPLPTQTLPGGSLAESVWADGVTLKFLNDGVKRGASESGWGFIDGVYDGFASHGYCAFDHWVVRLQESFMVQGEVRGAVHPNNLGYDFYGLKIAKALTADFYENNDLSSPRKPDQPADLKEITRPIVVTPATNDLTVDLRGPKSAAQGDNIGDQLTLNISNIGFLGVSKVTSRTSFAKQQGFNVDIVLSEDKEIPSGAARSSDGYIEDALLDGGRIVQSSIVGAGDTVTLRVSTANLAADTPPGDYYVCARVDTSNAVAESNERNNVGCAEITITKARALTPSLSIDPQKAEPGTSLLTSGRNFPPSTPIIISIDDLGISKTSTDDRGNFKFDLLVPDLPEGRVSVTALLGNRIVSSTTPLVILAKSAELVQPEERVVLTETVLLAASRTAAPRSLVRVPISLENVEDIGSMNFSIRYNPRVVTVNRVDAGDLVRGTLFQSNSDTDGVITFGLVVGRETLGDGPIAHVTFNVVGSEGQSTDLVLGKLFTTDSEGTVLNLNREDGEVVIKADKVKGDFNGDFNLSAKDALAALKMSVGSLPEDLNLDMDNDRKVTARDARMILITVLER